MVIDITPAPILSKGWGTPTNAALETLAAQAQTADEVAAIASSVADAKFAEVSVDLVDATMTATAETPSSDFAQHLNGTIGAATGTALRQAGKRWLILGTSIANGSNASNSVYAYPSQATIMVGSWRMAPIDSGSTLAANPGARLNYNVALLAALIETHQPEGVFLEVGPNDASNTSPTALADYMATVDEAIDIVQAAGLPMVITTPSPITAAAFSSMSRTRIEQQAQFIRLHAPSRGVQVADFHLALIDPATGLMAASYDTDGVHPNTLGHMVLAQVAASAIILALRQTPRTPVIAKGLTGGLVPNPLLEFTTTDPTSSTNQVAPTGSIVRTMESADTTGRRPAGAWHVVAADATSAAAGFTRSFPALTGWAVGDVLAVACYIEVTDIAGNWMASVAAGATTSVRVHLTNQSGVVIHTAFDRSPGIPVAAGVYAIGPVYKKMTIPTGVTTVNLWWSVTAAVGTKFTTRFSILDVQNLTTLGLA